MMMMFFVISTHKTRTQYVEVFLSEGYDDVETIKEMDFEDVMLIPMKSEESLKV